MSGSERWISRKGDTTGDLWKPKNIEEVRTRAIKAGKRFAKAFAKK